MSRGTNNGVAGGPPGHGDIPRGIEVLVKKASVDAEFRALLLETRAEAAAEIVLELDPAEVAILSGIPREQLEAIIARTCVRPEHRAAFAGRNVLLMLAAVGAGVLFLGVSLTATGGVRADAPLRHHSQTRQEAESGPAPEALADESEPEEEPEPESDTEPEDDLHGALP